MMGRRIRHFRERHRPGLHRAPGFIVMIRMDDPAFMEAVNALLEHTGAETGETRHPHITLFGPFSLKSPVKARDVLHAVDSSVSGAIICFFSVCGLLRLRGRKGIAIAWNVTGGQPLKDFHRNLAQSLAPLASRLSWIDKNPAMRQFHITLKFNLTDKEADLLWKSLHETGFAKCAPLESGKDPAAETRWPVIKIAIIRNGAIWQEFDLTGSVWLDRAGIFRQARLTTNNLPV